MGGGAVLARALFKEIEKEKIPSAVFIDDRYTGEIPSHMNVIRVAPTLRSRLSAEYKLNELALAEDTVFSFGNLPPLLKLKAKSIVYLHNRNLLPGVDISNFPFKARLRQYIERLWIRTLASNADYFAVQTRSMKKAFEQVSSIPCHLLPFVPNEVFDIPKSTSAAQYDFLYVASSDPHKNHEKLLEAWELLAKKDLFPSLVLTLPSSATTLLKRLEQLKENPKIQIHNFADLPYAQVVGLYSQCKAFIFPSLQESFGIPLIEANQAGLPILASNLDYVHDIVKPALSFDPSSSSSIALTVASYLNANGLNQESELKIKVHTPRSLLESLANL